MIRFSFGPAFSEACFNSWIKARVKHDTGIVSDVSFDGRRWSYTIQLQTYH